MMCKVSGSNSMRGLGLGQWATGWVGGSRGGRGDEGAYMPFGLSAGVGLFRLKVEESTPYLGGGAVGALTMRLN